MPQPTRGSQPLSSRISDPLQIPMPQKVHFRFGCEFVASKQTLEIFLAGFSAFWDDMPIGRAFGLFQL